MKKKFYVTRDFMLVEGFGSDAVFYSLWCGKPSLKYKEWVSNGKVYPVFCEESERWKEMGFPELSPGEIQEVGFNISKVKRA